MTKALRHWNRARSLLFFSYLLLGCWTNAFSQPGPERRAVARNAETHDTSHPFILANETDFLVAMIALSEESRTTSLVATKQGMSKKVNKQAINLAKRHRGDVIKLKQMLAKYGVDAGSDFHVTRKMSGLPDMYGRAAEKYYLDGTSQLLASKIELAELASGTVKSSEVRKLAINLIDSKSAELSKINHLLKNYQSN